MLIAGKASKANIEIFAGNLAFETDISKHVYVSDCFLIKQTGLWASFLSFQFLHVDFFFLVMTSLYFHFNLLITPL